MNGLILDTSCHLAILGLLQNQEIVSLNIFEGNKELSATLFPAIQSFCEIKNLDYISVGIGPGSYMGIRTAATVAKTLAFALNLPLIEFCSPLAFLPKGEKGSFAIIGDAKMGQLYLITGFANGSQISNLSHPSLISAEEVDSLIQDKDFVVGKGYIEPKPNLEWVAFLSYTRYIQGNFSKSHDLELIYLR